MIVKLLTEHHLEFLSLTGGCRGPSESTPQGDTLVFSCIRRLGPFFGVQNFEFQYFLGFSEE